MLPEAVAPAPSFLWQALAPTLAALGIAWTVWRMRSLRGTTLVAVAWWSIISLAVLGLSELLIVQSTSASAPWIAPLRFAAAMGTFTPGMALLGAKRPQDRGWQFIVLSLWLILSLPSLEWLVYDGQKELHPARFWFLTLLIVVGLCNGISTRYWLSHLLVATGQWILVAVLFGGGPSWLTSATGPPLGLAALALAELLWATAWPRSVGPNAGWDRVWLDFRDAFGVVWALRIAERVNASATMYDWPVALAWRGFVTRGAVSHGSQGPAAANAPVPIETLTPAMADSLRTLLRRFVAADWIDRRLAGNLLASHALSAHSEALSSAALAATDSSASDSSAADSKASTA